MRRSRRGGLTGVCVATGTDWFYDSLMTLRSLFRAAAWAALLVLVAVTISPLGWRPHTVTMVGLDRAAAFVLAGGIFAIAYPRRWISLALFLIAAAFFIEMLQWISPTRHARFSDALVKSLGSIIGLAAGKLALVARRHWLAGRHGLEIGSGAMLHGPAFGSGRDDADGIAERDAPGAARYRVPAE